MTVVSARWPRGAARGREPARKKCGRHAASRSVVVVVGLRAASARLGPHTGLEVPETVPEVVSKVPELAALDHPRPPTSHGEEGEQVGPRTARR